MVVCKLNRQTWLVVCLLRCTSLTVHLCFSQLDLLGIVRAREVVGNIALLLIADQACARQLTKATDSILVGPVSEVEVVDFGAEHSFLVTFLDLVCPQGTVDMHKLVCLERNQTTRDPPFAILFTKLTRENSLRIINYRVILLQHLN